MVIYLTPALDEQYAADKARMQGHTVSVMVLPMNAPRMALLVQRTVHLLSGRGYKMLIVPDDYHRHNDLIEHVKSCARHMSIPVWPLTKYLLETTPPASAPVHAKPEAAGGVVHSAPAPTG